MMSQQLHNEISTLSTVLLSHLDEAVFFSKLSGFFHAMYGEHKVQVYEVLTEGATRLVAENGTSVQDGPILAKGIGLSGYVARMKRAYYSNNVKRDPITAHCQRDASVEGELAVPVISEGAVIATIHIQSARKERQFGEQNILEVNEALKELGAPVRNMRLYLMARQLNRELEARLQKQERIVPAINTPELRVGTQGDERINLIGISKQHLDVVQLTQKLAMQDFPVLLEGQHGSGKKMIARKMHFWSARKSRACVLVHCTSMDEAALDSELFGSKGRTGAFVAANGGTLILDDIGSLSANLQSKVLRAMVTGEAISSDNTTRTPINVRIVATGKGDLADRVLKGEFKEELFYRLNTMSVRIASLRERTEDIKVLAEHFLNEGKSRDKAKILTNGALTRLSAYHWPGNIQELRGLMERLAVVVDGQYIDEQHLPELKQEEKKVVEVVVAKFVEMTLYDLEKNHIVETLEHLSGNKTRAAKMLGITVKTLYNKLHSYGMIETRADQE